MNFQHSAHLANLAAQSARDGDSAAESVQLLAEAVAALAMALDSGLKDLQQDIKQVEHQVRSR
jgi:hypothetical protein